MVKKVPAAKGKAPAPPVSQRHGLYQYFDKKHPRGAEKNRNVQTDIAAQGVPAEQNCNIPQQHVPPPNAPASTSPKPSYLDSKRLSKGPEADLDGFNASQVEWQDNRDYSLDNAGAGIPPACTDANKQRLVQGLAGQIRPAIPVGGGNEDHLLDEILAGMNTATGAVAAPAPRRASGESPAAGDSRGYRTPRPIHRPAGIMRQSNSRLGIARSTPSSVAFRDPYGGQSSASARRKPAVGTATAAKKRKQFVEVLDCIHACVDDIIAEKPLAAGSDGIPEENNAAVVLGVGVSAGGGGGGGPPGGIGNGGHGFMGPVAGGGGLSSVPGGAGPSSPTRPASQRRRTDGSGGGGQPPSQQDPPPTQPQNPEAQQAQQENGVSPGLMQSLRQSLAGWQERCEDRGPRTLPMGFHTETETAPPIEQQQQQQGQENPAAAIAGDPVLDPMQIDVKGEELGVTPQRRHKVPPPPAMPAPPPSPYVPHAPPSQARAADELAMAAMHQVQVQLQQQQQQQQNRALEWGDSSDDDDVALEAVTKLEAAAQQAQQAAPTQRTQPVTQPATNSAGVPPSLAGDRAMVHYNIVAVWPNCVRPDGTVETQLQLHNPYTNLQVIAHLDHPWNQDLDFRPNDPINLLVPQLDDFNGQLHCLLGGPRGHPQALLVHFPDVLLGGTRIAGSTLCPRQGYLQERIAGGDGTNEACTKGNMYHSLFQTALLKGIRQAGQLEQIAWEIVASRAVDLLDSQMTEHQAFTYLKESFPRTLAMLNKFNRPEPRFDVSAGRIAGQETKRKVAFPEVLDIEEYIAAPKFGLKGFVDASVRLRMAPVLDGGAGGNNTGNASSGGSGSPPGGEYVIAPLELKTGMPRDSDEAQVLLYLLAMEERYGHPLNWGLLINSNVRTQEPVRLVARQDHLLACLMAARNRLAASLARSELPALAENKSSCQRCFARTECMLTHAAIEVPAAASSSEGTTKGASSTSQEGVGPSNVPGAPSVLSFCHGMLPGRDMETLEASYQSETGHMTPGYTSFLRHWSELLDMEARGSSAQRPEIWAMTGRAREAAGRCVAGLTIVRSVQSETSGKWMYTFARKGGEALPCPFPLGEMLMLGVDGRHAGVCRGHLFDCSGHTLTVQLEKELREGLMFPQGRMAVPGACGSGRGNSGSIGIAGGGGAGTALPSSLVGVPVCDPSISWRLDKEEVGTTTPRMRGFLYSLFSRSVDRDGREDEVSRRAARLRQLIVDQAPPAPPPAGQLDPVLEKAVEAEIVGQRLNAEQAAAVRAAVSCEDYTLVLGMPGAGKTTAVVAMVRALAAAGKRVLLTSYTNSAVDNVLLKLAKTGDVPFVRVGREERVNPGLREWTPGGARHEAHTAGELAVLVDTVKIWGVSALGVTDALIRRRQFDVCIVDEAGQITLPATLGPLLRARAFVLVGDPHQLPPLVTNEAAADRGLSQPLFSLLAAAHPSAVKALPVQYRMAEDIQVLPNLITYNGQLRCGCEKVASAQLILPWWPLLTASLPISASASQRPYDAPWVQTVLDPSRRVVFLDTSAMPAPEIKVGEAVTNPSETEIALTLVKGAVRAGLAPAALGLISPYNRQVSLLDKLLRVAGVVGAECLTIDKAQGRDKDCVIVSLVKSNAEHETGKLLADARRVNVAITRAKAKLVLIGDAATLRTLPMFDVLLGECHRRGWIVGVPAGACAGPN